MATYRCPSCGAGHKEPRDHCRLCGASLMETMTISEAAKPQTSAGGRQGVGVIFLVGILGVLGVVLLAVLFGFGGDNDVVDAVKDEVPGLNDAGADGWQVVDDADGGFVIELPGTTSRGFVPFPGATGERADQVYTTLGPETQLSVSYAGVPMPEGLNRAEQLDYLKGLADNWAAGLGGKIVNTPTTETAQSGVMAVTFTVERLTMEGQPATAEGVLLVRQGRVYVIQSMSIYPDHVQLDRMRSTFAFTG